ncbi:MAG TPA: hypothetical protein VGN23_00755 [Verrucomicrobiae bacterium]|jgi:hypothetical protein
MNFFRITLFFTLILMEQYSARSQQWVQANLPQMPLSSVACSSDGSIMAVTTTFSGIYMSTKSGNSWFQTSAPINPWITVAMSADGVRIMACDENDENGNLGLIYISTNSGSVWNITSAPSNHWSCLAVSADGTKLVAGVSGGGVYRSTNSGFSWLMTSASSNWPDDDWVSLASSADGTTLMGSSWGNVYISTNSGVSWVQSPIQTVLLAICSSASGQFLTAALPTSGEGMFVSTNFGANWTSIITPDQDWNAIASSADGKRMVAAGANWDNYPDVIYISTNWAQTWIPSDSPTNMWGAISSSADGNKLIAMSENDSVQGGWIWTLQTVPSPRLNVNILATNLELSWIIPSTNFVLQQSADLRNWSAITNQPYLNLTNLNDEVTLPISNGDGFFRLATPK